jgi:hypothetical protein
MKSIFIAIVLLIFTGFTFVEVTLPEVTLSQEEKKLYELIMEYRGIPKIKRFAAYPAVR